MGGSEASLGADPCRSRQGLMLFLHNRYRVAHD
jgi:hypothetical protein